MSLDYGADIVYKRLLFSWALTLTRGKRDNSLVSRTCSQEKEKLVMQIRTSDPPNRAAAVGRAGSWRMMSGSRASLFKVTDICFDYDMISNA